MKADHPFKALKIDPEVFFNAMGCFPRMRILVIGDIMVDEYLWGSVGRISPEAPVQVVDVKGQEYRLGGCGNVVYNLSSLQASVSVASVIGDDAYQQYILSELKRLGVGTDCLLVDKARPTTKKTRVLASGQQIVRIDHETRKPISANHAARIATFLEKDSGSYDVIIMSDYGKGVLSDGVISSAVALGRKYSVPVLVDPKRRDLSKYSGATLITPNSHEAEAASHLEITGDASAEAAARVILRETACLGVLITRGKAGMTLLEGIDGRVVHIPTQAREVFDVSGAGDTVLSLLGLGIASGLSFLEASVLANIAGGIVVGKVGTSTVGMDELVASISERDLESGAVKERTIEEVATLRQFLKWRKKKIAFIDGNFDLFHSGHIQCLRKARKMGDVLVVGIHDNCSTRCLEATPWPPMSQEEQVQILSSLDCVDYIVPLAEGSPQSLIQTLQPDVVVPPDGLSIDSASKKDE